VLSSPRRHDAQKSSCHPSSFCPPPLPLPLRLLLLLRLMLLPLLPPLWLAAALQGAPKAT